MYPTDNLIAGYTPNATIMIWGGNADGRLLKPGSVSANTLGPVWREITLKTLARHPGMHGDFEVPEGVIQQGASWARVDGRTDYKIPGMTFVSKEENARKRLAMNTGAEE